MLAQYPADTAFRYGQMFTNMIDALATTCGAQKFPRAAWARISLSNVRSDTARRNRSFSF